MEIQGGYRKKNLEDQPFIWDAKNWTPEEWAVLCKACSLPPKQTECIVLHADVLESYATVDKKPGESSDRQEDICPICGGELDFEEDVSLNDFSQPDGTLYKWSCPNCGATGMAGFFKTFDRHYNVLDGNGNPFDGTVGEPT